VKLLLKAVLFFVIGKGIRERPSPLLFFLFSGFIKKNEWPTEKSQPTSCTILVSLRIGSIFLPE